MFDAFASINNDLCAPGAKGWLTVPFIPIIFGGLNIVIWILIITTAFYIRYYGASNWQNTDSEGNRTFSRSLGFAVLDWYVAALAVTVLYKLFLCKATVQATTIYTDVESIKSK
ncbi:MAG: hypothetical protein ACRYGR_09630 [Janthinobacterium lividum]